MNKEQFYLIKLAFTLILTSLSSIDYFIVGLAQPARFTDRSSDKIQIRFQQQDSDGSSRGRPSGRGGTGSRGDCPPVEVPLTALIPSNSLGFSLEAHPTLWFYVPYKSSEVTAAEFSGSPLNSVINLTY